MDTLVANRAQSAYSRTTYRSQISNDDNHVKQRPKTSKSVQRATSNLYEQNSERSRKSSTASSATTYQRRLKTASSVGTATTRPGSRKLRSDEIENLLRTLDRNDTIIVELDCLANYRTLIETIDLRQTPIDCRLLCALQQRENHIVQSNACRDTRFHSLLDLLQPKYTAEPTDELEPNETNINPVLEVVQ